MVENIRIINLDEFDIEEKQIFDRLTEEYGTKFERILEKGLIILHPKKYDKDGKRARYCINLRTDIPDLIFSAEAEEWDLAKALHKVFIKLENEVKKRLKL